MRDIEKHIKSCENCRLVFEQTRAMYQFMFLQKSLAPSPALTDRILAKHKEIHRSNLRLIYILRPLAAAAIIVLMVATGVLSGSFVAGNFLSGQASAGLADPVYLYAEDTYLPEADYFTPGYEFLNE